MKRGFKQEVRENRCSGLFTDGRLPEAERGFASGLARLLKKAATGGRPKATSLFTVLDKDLAGRLYLLDLRASKENL